MCANLCKIGLDENRGLSAAWRSREVQSRVGAAAEAAGPLTPI